MNSLHRFLWFALALSFVPSLAWADEPSLATWTERRVREALVVPLAKQEARVSPFSRGRPPPRERRVRALQTTASLDARDRAFVPFAIDVRFGTQEWQTEDVTGCVYKKTGEIFVKIGDAYRPSAFLLGKDTGPVAGVCVAAPPKPSA